MTQEQSQFRQALADSNLAELRGLWAQVAPYLPQPATNDDAEIIMRHAQTQTASIPFDVRAYAHAWLVERDLPSGLPDRLKPKAERLYPVLATAVGISVNTNTPEFKPATIIIRESMEAAVLSSYADGRQDPDFVRARMGEARARTMRQLFGV